MEGFQIPTDNVFKFLTVISIAGSVLFGKLSFDAVETFNEKAYAIEKEKGEYVFQIGYLDALDSITKLQGFHSSSITYYYTYDSTKHAGSQYYFNDKHDTSRDYNALLNELNTINKKRAELKIKQLISDNYLRVRLNNSIVYQKGFGGISIILLLLFFFSAQKWYSLDSNVRKKARK
jgi:hypothetical protein